MIKSDSSMTSGGVERLVRIGTQVMRVDVRRGDGSRTAGATTNGAANTGATTTHATPLLMCGGIGASYEFLQPLVDAIDPAIEIIRVDVPGVGGSPASPLPYTLPHIAALLSRMLDELGYREVDVLGYSWGGALAQQFALQYAGRCRRLVLVSTSTGALSLPGNPAVLAKMLTPQRFTDAAYAAGLLYGSEKDSNIDEVRAMFAKTRISAAGPGYFHQLLAVAAWTSLPFLPFIGQPVLILSGDDDPIVPVANARLMAGLLPSATVQVVAGGHAAVVTSAAEFGSSVSRFLAGDGDRQIKKRSYSAA